jgi:hypothetical protein
MTYYAMPVSTTAPYDSEEMFHKMINLDQAYFFSQSNSFIRFPSF